MAADRTPPRDGGPPPGPSNGAPGRSFRQAALSRSTRLIPGARQRSERILARRSVRDAIVSLAGLTGRPIRNQHGAEIGRLVDVVARWSDGQTYPPVTGLVVRVGRRLAFVSAEAIGRLEHAEVTLRSARLDLRDFERRPGEVMLGRDVLDHQLVDVDGVQVIRAADLYLAPVLGSIRLVGVDVSTSSLLRRLGPARWRSRPTPGSVIDWAAIQPFSENPSGSVEVRLRSTNDGLRRLRPSELADLLEDLQRPERQELLAALDPEEAADAIEEMEAEDVTSLLREADPEQAARLLASMEPDEAADALRDLNIDEREALLGRMPAAAVTPLRALLGHPEDQAGGFMTPRLLIATAGEQVGDVVDRLIQQEGHDLDLDAVAVVDDEGRIVGDLPLFSLLAALRQGADEPVEAFLDDDDLVTVGPEAHIRQVADQLVQSRRLSLLVVEEGRPIGRILADDVLDVLVPTKGRFHFPQLFAD